MRDFELFCADSLAFLKTVKDNEFDSIVTDPPYHLTQVSRGGSARKNDPNTPFGRTKLGEKGFMGKTWDGGDIAFQVELWTECLRVLKPGGHLLAFGGTRTFHRMMCAIEDAGFEMRDTMLWLYGTGFPKSQNISKMIDKKAGADRPVVGRYQPPGMDKPWNLKNATNERQVEMFPSNRNNLEVTGPVTDEAKQWDGWGTALKPAFEPIVLARKPLEGTVIENVRKWGTGGLNIDGCRIECESRPLILPDYKATDNNTFAGRMDGSLQGGSKCGGETNVGRFPANVILDEEAAAFLDALTSGKCPNGYTGEFKANIYGRYAENQINSNTVYGDSGGASRFFYCSKTSKKERGEDNPHPTVKPLTLMRYLCRLITPPDGVILDPFMGSGSTGIAALEEGFYFVGIDQEQQYVDIAEKRITEALPAAA